jgi:hypothetical protein
LRHAAETRNDAAVDESDAPSPSKAARTILSAPIQVKIASQPYSSLIFLALFELPHVRCGPLAALQQPDPQTAKFRCRSRLARSLTRSSPNTYPTGPLRFFRPRGAVRSP